jgi:hypothetical protein
MSRINQQKIFNYFQECQGLLDVKMSVLSSWIQLFF